eukprot:4050021-Pyramimonas_sp.AAC.1
MRSATRTAGSGTAERKSCQLSTRTTAAQTCITMGLPTSSSTKPTAERARHRRGDAAGARGARQPTATATLHGGRH